jgi:hypothetical protein
MVAGAPVRQSGGDTAQPLDEVIEGARIHASSNAGRETQSTVTIVLQELNNPAAFSGSGLHPSVVLHSPPRHLSK